LNNKGECEAYALDKCNLDYMSNYSLSYINECLDICDNNDFPSIYIKLNGDSLDLNEESYKNLSILNNSETIDSIGSQIYYNQLILTADSKNSIKDIPMCYNISSEDLKTKFERCAKVIYNPIDKSYQCFQCESGYNYNSETQKCEQIEYSVPSTEIDTPQITFPCEVENLGTNSTPIYSCIRCYRSYQTLTKFENGVKRCISIENYYNDCNESIADSSHLQTVYNCTSCKGIHYLPFYSKYYQRQICQYAYEDVIKKKNISFDPYANETSIKAGSDGVCQSQYFTPDGQNCYKCDNENVGMPGCNGECSFSPKRFNSLLCDGGCKEGYIESLPGVCESCEEYNEGCSQCHYDSNYLDNSIIQVKGKFFCDACKEGYAVNGEGRCVKCSRMISNCNSCEKY
jgi:hypothetical protein